MRCHKPTKMTEFSSELVNVVGENGQSVAISTVHKLHSITRKIMIKLKLIFHTILYDKPECEEDSE